VPSPAEQRCGTCGAAWSAGQFAAGCPECGGGALDMPCPACGGRCGSRWQRAVADSHEYKLGHWAGRCALPDEEQRPYNHAAAYAFLIQGYVDGVYSVERFKRLYAEHLRTPGQQPATMRADVRAVVEGLFERLSGVTAAAHDGGAAPPDLSGACRTALQRLHKIITAHRRPARGAGREGEATR
jgi:hypothetical protein